jgi:hypothetical protein
VAETTGFVQRLKWDVGGAARYAYIGDDPTSTEVFTIAEQAADSDVTISGKRGMARLLGHAQLRGFQVVVTHPAGGAELSRVETPEWNLTQNPVQLDAIEVTQAIQDLSQSVPLVASKRTAVRLYLSNYSSASMTVSGELSLRRAPSDVPVTIASVNTVLLDPAQAGNLSAARGDAAHSLNFLLPDTHTVEGPLTITIASINDVGTGNQVSIGHERRPTVRFIASPPLRVRVLGMRYQQGNPPVTYVPANVDFALLMSWLGRAYPVGQVVSSQTVIDVTAAPPFGCGDINAQLAAIRALDMSAGGDPRTHYYGLVSDGGFFMRGCAAGIPATADPSTVASGPTGPATWGWDFDGSYGDWYGGHELGHTFGRKHPGFCGESQDDLQSYPFASGQLAGSDNSFAGFDVGDPAQGLPMVALRGQSWHDVMTYCNYQWLSPYTYRGILARLITEGS